MHLDNIQLDLTKTRSLLRLSPFVRFSVCVCVCIFNIPTTMQSLGAHREEVIYCAAAVNKIRLVEICRMSEFGV